MVGYCNRCSICSQRSNIALIGCCISKTTVIVLNDTVLGDAPVNENLENVEPADAAEDTADANPTE